MPSPFMLGAAGNMILTDVNAIMNSLVRHGECRSRYHRLTLSHSVLILPLLRAQIHQKGTSRVQIGIHRSCFQSISLFFYKVKSVSIALSQFHIQEKIYEQQTFKGSKNPTLAAKIRGECFILSL